MNTKIMLAAGGAVVATVAIAAAATSFRAEATGLPVVTVYKSPT